MERPERLSLQSADGAKFNLDALYQIAPSCFTEATDPKTGKLKRVVNFDVLRQLLGDDTVEDATEAYEFNWVGKQEARAEVLRPINKTLRPVKEDSVDWDNTQNLYIEGDNLEVLKLLQKSYLGKVKMIYIDPPYNTGNDFVYHDDSSRSLEEEDFAAGNIDELGNRYRKNTDANGRFHSEWCSMIYTRLMVARSLLSDDGVILISIDDCEQEHIKAICDEIYGSRNRISTFAWNCSTAGGIRPKHVSKTHEYIFAYAKDIDNVPMLWAPLSEGAQKMYNEKDEKGLFRSKEFVFKNSSTNENQKYWITCPDGTKVKPRQGYIYRFVPETFEEAKKSNLVLFKTTSNSSTLIDEDGQPAKWNIFIKKYFGDGLGCPSSLLPKDIISMYNKGTQDVQDLFDGNRVFENVKPVSLIHYFTRVFSSKEDACLDFFSGSGTTAHAIMQRNSEDQMNRKFILVQLPEETPEDSDAYIAGYKNICEIGKERIRRAGKKIKEEHPEAKDLDIGFRVFRVDESNFEDVERTPKEYNQDQLDLFLNNVKTDRDDLDLLFGCMLDWGVKLSLPMSSEEVDGKMIYTVNDGDLVACFADKVTDKVVKAMADKQPLRVIFRDSCFEQDADKINIYETFKQLLDWSDENVKNNIRVI